MKHLNFLSNLLSLSLGSQSSDVSLDCRLTVGSPSLDYRSKLLRLVFLLAILLTLGVGEMWATDPTWTHTFSSLPSISEGQFTVNSATWSISTTIGAGSPPISLGNDNSVACMKFGSGKKNCYSAITLSTSYFADYNVKSVYIVGAVNSSSTSITVTQGTGGSAVTIGTTTISQAYGDSWQNNANCQKTINTNKGNGGTLTISISPSSCAFSLRQITVTYEEGSSCSGTKLGTPVVTATTSNTQVVLSWGAVSNASGYKYKWNGGSWTETASTSVTKTGLTNGTEYTYQVQAIGDGDDYCDGDASAEASITAGPCYTVSFSTGTGNPTVTSVTEDENEGCIELPDGPTPACSEDGWVFAGWSETAYTVDNTTNVGRLRMPGDYYCPDGSNRTLYAVYRKLTSGTSSATYTANSRSNLTLLATSESVDYWWYHTATGVEFYINNYGIYDDKFDLYNSKGSDNNGWALIDAHRPITQISLSIVSGTPYASLSSAEPDAGTVSLDGSTITCTGNVTKVVLETSTTQYSEVELSAFTVTYKNCKFLSNPSCCDKAITVSSPTITGEGTVVFTPSESTVATCDDDVEIVARVTPASGYECTALSFTGGSVSVSPAIASNKPAYPSYQDFTLSFAQNTNATLTTTATFSAKTATSWTWTYNSGAIPNPFHLYVNEVKQLDVTYTPTDLLSSQKNYSVDKESSVAQVTKQPGYYKMRGAVGVTELTNTTVTFTLGELEQVVNVTVEPLPIVYFVDNVHNESFSNVTATVSDGIVTLTKSTPTHNDDYTGSTANTCEETHLHLVGWIYSEWSGVANYMNGTSSAPSTTAISSAKVGVAEGFPANTPCFFAPSASINTETWKGKTFYAVWAKEE